MSNLDGHVDVVTGASSGLGEQLARALAAAGATPVLAARRAEPLALLQRELAGVDSDMTAEVGDDPDAFPPFMLERTPLGRGGRAGELDDAVLFLLGAGSSFVTGHVLSVDGGMAVR